MEDVRDTIMKPCDELRIPVYATYRSVRGIVANKAMFFKTDIVVLRYVEDDSKSKDIIVIRPQNFEGCKNYWDTDEKKWVIV